MGSSEYCKICISFTIYYLQSKKFKVQCLKVSYIVFQLSALLHKIQFNSKV